MVDEISTRWNRFAMKSAFGRLYKNAINRWRTTWWIDTSCHDLALPWFLTSLHELNCIRNVRRTIHAVGNSWRHRLQFMHLADAIRCRLIASANKKRTQLGAFCFALIDACSHFVFSCTLLKTRYLDGWRERKTHRGRSVLGVLVFSRC